MNRKNPIVSIGMPVYNEAKWLHRSLDALLSQTFEDFELIISDNISTDDTWHILQEYAVKDSRIVLHRQLENLGPVGNFKFVLAQACSDYFMWAGGHDVWSPNLLEVLINDLQANPGVVLSVPGGALIDEEDRPIRYFNQVIDTRPAKSAARRMLTTYRQMERANAIYGLHRRSVLEQTLPWPRVVGVDNIILMRMAALGDIITNQSAHWFRRKNRHETSQQAARRRVGSMDVSKLAFKFPYLSTRVALMIEFLKADGSYQEKIALFRYGLNRLFLASTQRRLLAKEFFSGSSISDLLV